MAPPKIPDENAFNDLAGVFSGLSGDQSGLKKAIAKLVGLKVEGGSFTEATTLEGRVGTRATALHKALGEIVTKLDDTATNLKAGGKVYENTEDLNKKDVDFS